MEGWSEISRIRGDGAIPSATASSADRAVCRSCGATGLAIIYEASEVPVHSVLLMPTRDAALKYPKRDVRLGFCQRCGFIANIVFDNSKLEYSSSYEETQGFSPTFQAFQGTLARELIDRYDLHHKTVLEIGCGKGEFLALLCELGPNWGIGFDPAFVAERFKSDAKGRITFIQDFYSEKYEEYKADLVCCKMTLEHIQNVSEFVQMVRRCVDGSRRTTVFFQVPDVRRILRDTAFWDIYYEHCSYFSAGSLARLFRRAGFTVVEVRRAYDDQYVMIGACAGDEMSHDVVPGEEDVEELADEIARFRKRLGSNLHGWRRRLNEWRERGRRIVIWGGGSKAVSFLNTLQVREGIEYVVDVNPYRQGTYVAGTGQEIVPPCFLESYRPDVVVVMNAVYRNEIQRDLRTLDVTPELIAL